jgi:uncharacterized membrane protein (UPF0127 family)
MHVIRTAWFLIVLVLAAVRPAVAAEQGEVVIETAEGRRHIFRVEVVSTREEMAFGLMYRTHLAPDAGMLFLYPSPRETSFWMENTYLPLDMLFIDEHGVIRNIAERTVPLSTTAVPSRGEVIAVLEVNGGTSERLGISVGDRVTWELVDQR